MKDPYIIQVGLIREIPRTATAEFFGPQGPSPARQISSDSLVQPKIYFVYEAPRDYHVISSLLQTPDLALEYALRSAILRAVTDSLELANTLDGIKGRERFNPNMLHIGCFSIDDIKDSIVAEIAEYLQRALYEGGDAAYIRQQQKVFSLFLGDNQRQNLKGAKVIRVQGKFNSVDSLDKLLVRVQQRKT